MMSFNTTGFINRNFLLGLNLKDFIIRRNFLWFFDWGICGMKKPYQVNGKNNIYFKMGTNPKILFS